MTNDKYILRYLPLFYKDLEEKIVYIAETLQNSKAAQELLDAVEKAILERYVKNYIVYYVVIDDEGPDKIMEVRRFLYNKQNQHRLV